MSTFFLTKWFNELKDFIGGLFDAAERAWDNLDEDVQNAMIQGSGIVSILNNTLDMTPDFVFEKITEKFPDLTEENLRKGVDELSQVFNIPIEPDLFQTIQNIQEYLKTKVKDDSIGDAILSASAQILSVALAPDKTTFAKIGMLIEYVYREFIKK